MIKTLTNRILTVFAPFSSQSETAKTPTAFEIRKAELLDRLRLFSREGDLEKLSECSTIEEIDELEREIDEYCFSL